MTRGIIGAGSPLAPSNLRGAIGGGGRYEIIANDVPLNRELSRRPPSNSQVPGPGPGPIGLDQIEDKFDKTKISLGANKKPGNGGAKKGPAWQDADYNSQIRAIERALNSYKARMGLERTQLGGEYTESTRALGEQKGRDLKSMEEDFASRGVITSGVYGTSVGDYNEEWGYQNANLGRQYKDSLALISQGYQEYLNEVQQQREEARLAAIRRRAQELETNPKNKNKNKKKKQGTSSTSTNEYKPGRDDSKKTSSISKGNR